MTSQQSGDEDATGTEAKILQAVKFVLTSVVKETATAPGMKHPLSDSTINDIRQCMTLIAARERELQGGDSGMRPRTPGDGKVLAGEVAISLEKLRRQKDEN